MNIIDLIDPSDLIGSLTGAALGFLGAYWILRLQMETETRKAKEDEVDQFKYIISLVERSIRAWRRYIKDTRKFGIKSKRHPLDIHPHSVIVNIAHRTLQRLDRFRLRTAAIQALGEEAGEREQREIAVFIDAQEVYSEQLEHLILDLKEDQGRYRWQFENASFMLLRRMNEMGQDIEIDGPELDPIIAEIRAIYQKAISIGKSGPRPSLEDKVRVLVDPVLKLAERKALRHARFRHLVLLAMDMNLLRQRLIDKGEEIHERVEELTNGMEDHLERAEALIDELKSYHDHP